VIFAKDSRAQSISIFADETTIEFIVRKYCDVLIPVVDTMKRDLLAGGYIQADETHVGVQTPDKKGENHKAYFWQYSAPMKNGVPTEQV
jgi:hypothetical protein